MLFDMAPVRARFDRLRELLDRLKDEYYDLNQCKKGYPRAMMDEIDTQFQVVTKELAELRAVLPSHSTEFTPAVRELRVEATAAGPAAQGRILDQTGPVTLMHRLAEAAPIRCDHAKDGGNGRCMVMGCLNHFSR